MLSLQWPNAHTHTHTKKNIRKDKNQNKTKTEKGVPFSVQNNIIYYKINNTKFMQLSY